MNKRDCEELKLFREIAALDRKLKAIADFREIIRPWIPKHVKDKQDDEENPPPSAMH